MTLKFDCRHRFANGFQLDVRFETDALCTVLFGPSGSGKTSVLSMIAGILKPEEGSISIAGQSVFDSSKQVDVAPESRNVGLVFQEPRLFPHKTVMQNLEFGQHWRKSAKNSMDIQRIAEVLEVADLLNRMPVNLSGGEKQRVALGRALASGPGLLLMDEPLSSLDSMLKTRVLMFLDRVLEEWQIPTVYVTHSHAEARRVARHVLLMENGRLVAEGTPDEMLSRTESLSHIDLKAPLNLVPVDKTTEEQGTVYAWIGEWKLMISPQSTDATNGQKPLIQFSPSDVIISRDSVARTSVRNRMQGTIRQMVPFGNSLLLAIDVGQIIWAVLTLQASRELELETGVVVDCLIKAHNVQFVD